MQRIYLISIILIGLKKLLGCKKNWIGKSIGAFISFSIVSSNHKIKVFTTRPDTLFGATYIVISPEHSILKEIVTDGQRKLVDDYCIDALKKNEIQRMDNEKEKTGVFTGFYAINPVNNKKIPIWVADYVLVGYGTGMIMAVPGHDERDYEFAQKYELNIIQVVKSEIASPNDNNLFTDEGIAINSDFLNELTTKEAKLKMIDWIKTNKVGDSTSNYRLRDWLISRQRYWGTPIPIVYDPTGKPHPVPEKYLPWTLPEDVEYKPKGTSPLGSSKDLVDRTEKIFGKGWRPEIDTMDTFVCSSWYYLRYPDASNNEFPFTEKSNKWLPVDYYIGGSEHATMHLLYARFITKALQKMKFINFSEPFTNLFHQGIITKDGSKMSKSKGNTVSPDTFVENYGSDTFRCYLMFMGPYDEGGDWNDKGINGIYRFLLRAFKLVIKSDNTNLNDKDEFVIHSTIKCVTDDLSNMKFNTGLSRLMEFVNNFLEKGLNNKYKKVFIQLLSPFAPHISEELWEYLGSSESIFSSKWPSFNKEKLVEKTIKIVIQVNGKLRGSIEIDLNESKENILGLSRDNSNVKSFLDNKEIIREIYVPGKLVNFVIK